MLGWGVRHLISENAVKIRQGPEYREPFLFLFFFFTLRKKQLVMLAMGRELGMRCLLRRGRSRWPAPGMPLSPGPAVPDLSVKGLGISMGCLQKHFGVAN